MDQLIELIEHLPNLQAILNESVYFGKNMNTTLKKYPKLLQAAGKLSAVKFISWHLPYVEKVDMSTTASYFNITNLVSLCLENRYILQPEPEGLQETPAVSKIASAFTDLCMPALENLSLHGVTKSLLGLGSVASSSSSWSLPNITLLEVDFHCGFLDTEMSVDDTQGLLQKHGSNLQTLNIHGPCLRTCVDMNSTFSLYPNLRSLSFCIHWGIPLNTLKSFHSSSKLAHIGFDYLGSLIQFEGKSLHDSVAENIKKLNRSNFPLLSSIQLLKPSDLHLYMEIGGEALTMNNARIFLELQKHCATEGIQLEDCTGNKFGTPPEFPSLEGPVLSL